MQVINGEPPQFKTVKIPTGPLCDVSIFGDVIYTTPSWQPPDNSLQSAISVLTSATVVPVVMPVEDAEEDVTNSDCILKKSSAKVHCLCEELGRSSARKKGVKLRDKARDSLADYDKIHLDGSRKKVTILVDELLTDIYTRSGGYTDYNSATSGKSIRRYFDFGKADLEHYDLEELRELVGALRGHVTRAGNVLLRRLKRRDALKRQREAHCDVITVLLRRRYRASYPDDSTVPDMRFSITPLPTPPLGVPHPVPTNPPTSSDSGFHQWHSAMKLVAQLPEGIPPEFRRRLWLALADRHLAARRIDWKRVECNCFSEWSHPSDAELGVQIVKDLHRTGCSLFCGEDGVENQALLKKVLLAYARWNKSVGYCQGFNMLAALILQVTDRNESDALKLMIYLIEGVLPDSYFADSLRGLSVDMAVFRDLLRTKLPKLSRHLDSLQLASKEGSTSYEPPLTNVFTMQWFLTLFCNCLPQKTVLRVWDLILLEGNEILLRTALAIWQVLAARIMTVRSADEFYCMMGVLMREILDNDLASENALITGIVNIGKLTELKSLREHYLYNINPWGGSIPRPQQQQQDKRVIKQERLALDIGVLKKQYVKLKQRQRQAHIIFSAAVARQPASKTAAPVAMNHLLLGRSALAPVKRLGPPKGTIPPVRQPPTTLLWKDTAGQQQGSSSTDSSDTELCDNSDDEDNKNQDLPLTTDDNQQQRSKSDTSILSNVDNTTTAAATSSPRPPPIHQIPLPDVLNASKVDVIDVASITTTQPSITRSDSVESVDFERFLAERVRDLKSSSDDDGSDQRGTGALDGGGRRNSQRALEIIQENSMILHRILQCQSRLSSSPEPEDDLLLLESLESDSPDRLARVDEDMAGRQPTPIIEEGAACKVKTEDKVEEDAKADVAVAEFLRNYKHLFEKPSEENEEEVKIHSSDDNSKDNIKARIDLFQDITRNNLSLLEIYSSKCQKDKKSLVVADDNSSIIPPSTSLRNLPPITPTNTYNHKQLQNSSSDNTELKCHYDDEEEADYNQEKYRNKSIIVDDPTTIAAEDLIEIDKNSKYNSIIAYSRNLDEKFNSLILNSPKMQRKDQQRYTMSFDLTTDTDNPTAEQPPRSSHSFTDFQSSSANELLYELGNAKRIDRIDEVVAAVTVPECDDIYVDIALNGSRRENTDLLFTDAGGEESPNSGPNSPLRFDKSQTRSKYTLNMDTLGESSGLKSPNRIYNPFPVSISSRQNKARAVQLGLYKK